MMISKSSNLLKIASLPNLECEFTLNEAVELRFVANDELSSRIHSLALELKPWRKGPFKLNELFIDSEWRSFIKFNILAPHLDLYGKDVADVGCNNGYYMFKMLEFTPKSVTGFDPSEHCFEQFSFINHFAQKDVKFELLGVEALPGYGRRFDTIFCLGVIYHRSDPIKMLKELKSALKPNGEVFLDTMFIERDDEFILSPRGTYSKIPNVYFIPSIKALQNWCERARFSDFEILDIKKTDLNEQRKTEWIDGQSLGDFLDPNDENFTIEGYPAPKRVYIRLKNG